MFILRLSPDLTRYFYTAEDEAGLSLWTGHVAQPGNDTRLASAGGYVRWPTRSPASDRIVYEQGVLTGNTWLADLSE